MELGTGLSSSSSLGAGPSSPSMVLVPQVPPVQGLVPPQGGQAVPSSSTTLSVLEQLLGALLGVSRLGTGQRPA
jgi:hypothetical protein